MILDAIDKKIIAELSKDARIPFATLANKVALSRHSVRLRIDRLESQKIITGYTIKFSAPEDTDSVNAVMLVYRKDRMRGADVTSFIAKIPEVRSCSILSGEIDLMVQIKASSHSRVNEIWSELSALPGVQNITTCFVLSSIVEEDKSTGS